VIIGKGAAGTGKEAPDLRSGHFSGTGADAVVGSFSLNFSIFRKSLSLRNLLNVSLL